MQEKDETLKKLKRRLKILIALLALLVVFLLLFIIITSNNSGLPLSFLVIAFIIALLTFLNAIFLLSRL